MRVNPPEIFDASVVPGLSSRYRTFSELSCPSEYSSPLAVETYWLWSRRPWSSASRPYLRRIPAREAARGQVQAVLHPLLNLALSLNAHRLHLPLRLLPRFPFRLTRNLNIRRDLPRSPDLSWVLAPLRRFRYRQSPLPLTSPKRAGLLEAAATRPRDPPSPFLRP